MDLLNENQVRDLAAALHAKQIDKAGRPYIDHLERVVRNLKGRGPDASPDEIAAMGANADLSTPRVKLADNQDNRDPAEGRGARRCCRPGRNAV